jgi:hypothetical protein
MARQATVFIDQQAQSKQSGHRMTAIPHLFDHLSNVPYWHICDLVSGNPAAWLRPVWSS